MRAHILQHTVSTTPGSTLEWLKLHQIPYTITRFFEPNPTLPEISTFDFLIICGGDMNVDQVDKYPWLRAEKILIKQALKENKKVIGLCLGGQLMAEALGARVGPHENWAVGWHPVEIKYPPHFQMAPLTTLMTFQFHGYSFDTPKGAVSFASSKTCRHQGFLWEGQAIGLQFHPESTKEWVLECAGEKLPSGPHVQTAQKMIEGNQYQGQLQAWYFELLTALKNSPPQ